MRASRSLLLAGVLLASPPAPGLRAAPAAKPEAPAVAPAPASESVLAPADVKTLRDTIDGLRQRYETQGTVLTKVNQDLDEMRSRLDQTMRAGDLDALKASLAGVVRSIADLQSAVGRLAADAERRSAEATTRLDQLAAGLTRLQEQAARTDTDLEQLRKSLATMAPPPVPGARGPGLGAIVAVCAVCTLALGALILILGAQRRREQQATLAAITGAIGQTREEFDRRLQAAAVEMSRLLAANETGLAAELGALRRAVESLPPHATPPVVPPPPAVVPRKTPPSIPTPTEDKTTVPGAGPALAAFAASLWPAGFLDPASPLARWRVLLESHLASADHPARPVLSTVLAMRVTVERSPNLQEVADAVAAVSLAAHTYWSSLPDLSEDDRQRASADWIRGLKQYVAGVAPTLDIRDVEPGVRFDPDMMQTVQSGAGNHLNVAAKFSWVILDRGGERTRVLHRARIATT